MTGSWMICKWSVVTGAALFCLLLSFGLGYFWRDKQGRKKIGTLGWAVMLGCTAQNAIQDVFENVYATRAAYIALGAAILIATVLLMRWLVSAKDEVTQGGSKVEYLQPLRF